MSELDKSEQMSETGTAYQYDVDGYLMYPIVVQRNPKNNTVWLLPPRTTMVQPEVDDNNFCKYDAASESWEKIEKPTSADDFVGIWIDSKSTTPHNTELISILFNVVGESETYKIVRDEGLRFGVEKVPEKTIEEVKEQKLFDLEHRFIDWYEKGATVTSSLGFVADSDSRAIMDIGGLVTSVEAQTPENRSTVTFMDHDNIPHKLTLDQLRTLQLEVIQNGQSAYAQKWSLRTQIENAESIKAIQSIDIVFTGLDFSSI